VVFQPEGVLREITGRARNRAYRADAVLAAIAEPLLEDIHIVPEQDETQPPPPGTAP
jgi:hypothetical protein